MSDINHTEEKNRVEHGMLYLVATPIGNLSDLSPRAVKVLSEVDFVAAEDTRNSGKLLSVFHIKKPMISYFEHNKKMRGESIVRRLLAGESCALITDAGTPAVSDPGEDIVRLCAENDIPVTAIPGCCAAIDALSLSGLSTRRFAFEGFLPQKKTERCRYLETLKNERRTLIFYEAPHRLTETLDDLCAVFGDRRIALCRELTKRNEEILRLSLKQATAYYEKESPRGEYVLILEGAAEHFGENAVPAAEENPLLSLTEEEHVAYYERSGLSRMDAIKAAAHDRGMPKNALYKLLNHTNKS